MIANQPQDDHYHNQKTARRTMEHEIETMWMDGMRFNALVQGHTVVMDAPERVGGTDEGTVPKPLVLAALAGCTGMDVIGLLRKDGRTLRSFAMRVRGELSKGAPMVYVAAHLLFEAEGDHEDEQAVINMVRRSQNELCGVAAMLRCSMPVTWELRFNGSSVATGAGPSATRIDVPDFALGTGARTTGSKGA